MNYLQRWTNTSEYNYDWFTNRRLGLVFEAVVNDVKLMVCSIDLADNIDKRPVARQMLQTDAFVPKHTLDIKLIGSLAIIELKACQIIILR